MPSWQPITARYRFSGVIGASAREHRMLAGLILDRQSAEAEAEAEALMNRHVQFDQITEMDLLAALSWVRGPALPLSKNRRIQPAARFGSAGFASEARTRAVTSVGNPGSSSSTSDAMKSCAISG